MKTECSIIGKGTPNDTKRIMGTTGIVGIMGTTGIRGYTGIEGITGIRGYTGIEGITGVSGVTGYFGSTGFSGYTGYGGSYRSYTGGNFSGYGIAPWRETQNNSFTSFSIGRSANDRTYFSSCVIGGISIIKRGHLTFLNFKRLNNWIKKSAKKYWRGLRYAPPGVYS